MKNSKNRTTISKGIPYKGGKQLIQTHSNGISVQKKYYMDGINQEYDIKKNNTKRRVYVYMRRGKWVKEYMDTFNLSVLLDQKIEIKIPSKIIHDVSDMRSLGIIQNFNKSHIDIRPYGDTLFIINSESKGLKFIDNFQSINILKDYRKFLSSILNGLKSKIKSDNEIITKVFDDKDYNTQTINIKLKQIL